MASEPRKELGADVLAEPFLAAWRAAVGGSRPANGAGGAVELAPFVWRVPMLAPAACAELLREFDRRRAEVAERGATPNSMHEHGFVLAPLGYGPLIDDLVRRLVAPIAAQLFAPFVGAGVDDHHAYVVDYATDADEELGFHVDDSEVTLNLCLGESFSGAELVMLGLRCDAHRQTPVQPGESLEIEHTVGTAILHAGRHRHRVDPIRGGRRRNLIVWCRSSSVRSRAGEESKVVRASSRASSASWCAACAALERD
jgi:hypothetical protein